MGVNNVLSNQCVLSGLLGLHLVKRLEPVCSGLVFFMCICCIFFSCAGECCRFIFFYCKTPKMFRWPWRVTTCPQAWRWEEDAWMFLFGWTFPLREYSTRKFSSDPSGLVGTAFCQTDLHLAKQKGNRWTSLAAQLNRHFFDRKINFRSLSLEDWNDIISNPNFICLSSGEWNALAALDDSRWASEAGDLSHRLTRRFNRCQRLMIDSI